ncbi:MAG: hypothetical protein RIS88_395 [Pseudomonadota bacterium]|jgi:hypothetical protein
MKVLTTLLVACLPVIALAQAPAPAAPKPAPAKPAPAKPARNPGLAPSAQKAVEERTPIEDEPMHELSPLELEIARAVHVGTVRCELGASVTIAPGRREGFFIVTTKNQRFRMHPTESRTGAIRLEDPKRGAMWLQLANKSMLMSQKLGQRLADECQSPQQIEVADAMKRNPPPSILDAPAPR